MHIHILGICGTFMGSLAVLARQLGHTVSGSDANVYPPMSTQLEQQGIEIHAGFLEQAIDESGTLVTPTGNRVMGYLLDAAGKRVFVTVVKRGGAHGSWRAERGGDRRKNRVNREKPRR